MLLHSPAGLANLYADIGRDLAPHHRTTDALAAVARAAATRVPGVERASVTRGDKGSFVTVAATDPAAQQVYQLQHDLGTGPCVDAILQETACVTGDLGAPTAGGRSSGSGPWPPPGCTACCRSGCSSKRTT